MRRYAVRILTMNYDHKSFSSQPLSVALLTHLTVNFLFNHMEFYNKTWEAYTVNKITHFKSFVFL